jgi:hypothetical protein
MEFSCWGCHRTFSKTPEQEAAALAEFARDYPGVPLNEAGQLCDGCYEKYLEWAKAECPEALGASRDGH